MQQKGSIGTQKHPTPVPILSQISPVSASTSYFLNIHYHYYPPIYVYVVQVFSFPQPLPPPPSPSHQTHISISVVSHTCYMPFPSHFYSFDHPNNIWWEAEIMKLLVYVVFSIPCYLVLLRPTYLLQFPILEHLQTMFLPHCDRPSFTPIKQQRIL